MGVKRGVISSLVVLVTVGGLTACESFARGPAAVSRDGTDLLVAICVDLTVNRIYGEAATPSSREVDFAELEGELTVKSGTVLNLSRPIDGLDGKLEPLDLTSVNELLLIFKQGPDDGFAAQYGGDGPIDFPTDGWLQSDGSRTDEPCG